jgi:hypothetical protein
MFTYKQLVQMLIAPALLGLILVAPAQATTVMDNYIGSNDHGYGDVIGDASIYGIQSMNVTVTGTTLNVSISTNFAGNAGADSSLVGNGGIGYGDLFLSSSWNPYGTASDGYASDDASNGTVWNYGISLDNRLSNSGGVATLYSLNAGDNSDVLLSDHFINCGSSCIYRNGQAMAVDTSVTDLVYQVDTGLWSVDTNNSTVNFSIDLANTTGLLGASNMGIHWGMTCANDVIEGSVSTVPVPAAAWLFGSGLLGLVGVARRKKVS